MKKFYYLFSIVVLCFCLLSEVLYAQTFREPEDLCIESTVVCNMKNYRGILPDENNLMGGPSCGGALFLHNSIWLTFVATSSQVKIEVTPLNCEMGLGGIGIQGSILNSCPKGFPFSTIGRCQSLCATTPFILGDEFPVFKPGKQYWIFLDGCAGSICDFEITKAEGVFFPTLSMPEQIIAPEAAYAGDAISAEIPGAEWATDFVWDLGGYVLRNENSSGSVKIPRSFRPGTYSLCLLEMSNVCMSISSDLGFTPYSLCKQIEILPSEGLIHALVSPNSRTLDHFDIYPNPVHSALYIGNMKVVDRATPVMYYIYDMNGKLCSSATLIGNIDMQEISFLDLNPGVYILNLVHPEFTASNRIVKGY